MKYLAFILVALVANQATSDMSKIDRDLLRALRSEETESRNVFIEMTQSTEAVLRKIESTQFSSRAAKITELKSELESLAKYSQSRVVSLLESEPSPVTFTSFWISNQVFVKSATLELISTIASLPEVARVSPETSSFPIRANSEKNAVPPNSKLGGDPQWNVQRIGADSVWNMAGGNQGEGVVIATIAVGSSATHVFLRDNWRQDYGWRDPYGSSEVPSDSYFGLGTWATGLAVGKGGIGVAPGAKWIACRGCGSTCEGSALQTCSEWVMCPTLVNGSNPDCSKAPHIVLGEWSGSGYRSVIDAWTVAGIIPIFVWGSGGECNHTELPSGYDNVLAAGATYADESINYSSDEGSSGITPIKPDFVAPGGSKIWSASDYNDEGYRIAYESTLSSGHHLAGAVALLLSEDPTLTFEQVKRYLQDHAERNLPKHSLCRGSNSTTFPNRIYGHGRINVHASLLALKADSMRSL